ncbi:unnamed protein product [Rotaria sp. Silwood2]|nr:unnamed protein product [Rotaria sp. Silwood2]CAF4300321.1 unnamed protein product [Rotaria sp. Silwood2]
MSNKSNVLPDNVMEFEDERFFEFVRSFAGEKLATLLEYQDINSVCCLLAADDPFEILSYDSDDLLDLKKKTCIKLNTNVFSVLPGIKSKMILLKNALIKKQNELKKKTKKMSSNIPMPNNIFSMNSTTNYSTISVCSSVNKAVDNSSLFATNSNFEENLKKNIINSLYDWLKKNDQSKNQQNYQIKEGIDYEIIVNSVDNKVLIRCQCGINYTLGHKDNNYLLSNYTRHLTNKNPCSMVQQKLKDLPENLTVNAVSTIDYSNTSIDPIINTASNSMLSIQTPLKKRKKNQTSGSSLSTKKK